MSFIIGLTGGIGSGKSAVADFFSALGVAVVDTDAIAHELTAAHGAAMAEIAAEFGPGVIAPDGRLNRDAMRRLVAEMAQAGGNGAEAVTAWVERKGGAVERVRQAVHEIAASGLTLSKLTVAASMLGDLARN